ncbi:T9SS type A sorting domain-containing protein [Pseudofulvibacter geojedonensis]|uniref:T9SS type A sorting domain-containing protein n=1 Tax=Pseudofulvibacter geojedonensis TaxID=1123758 RepID=A0ABW3HYL5_9FLAO
MKTKQLYVLLLIYGFASAQISTTNIRAKYNFANGAVLEDSSVGGNDFTQTGTALTEVNDRFDSAPTSAINLNGDYLTRPNISIAGSNPFSDAFDLSYSFWLKTNTNTSDIKTIIDDSTRDTSAGFDSNDIGYYIFYRNGKINLSSRFVVTNPGNNPSVIGYGHEHPMVISDGEWHHIVITFSATEDISSSNFTSNIYIDNVLDTHTIVSAPITTSPITNGNVTVANSRYNHLPIANRYSDVIDDILIYNRRFTAAEVETLANYNNYCFKASTSILSISDITNTTAKVTIASDGDVYDLAYHKTSEPFSNATIITNISSTTVSSIVNLIGLDVFTDYEVYIKKQCVNNPNWSDSKNFQTTQPNPKIYVNKNATGNNDGTSWANAYTDLQTALNIATSSVDVWVAKGIYKPIATTDRSASFVLNTNLFGGFEGTETTLSDRDITKIHTTNETILSGDLLGDDDATVDFNDLTRDDNSRHVVEVIANNIEINGVTVKDGYADATSGSDRFGAGIYKAISVTDLIIKNCVIKNNVALSGAGLSITSNDTSSITIDACVIEHNLANVGAGIDYHLSGSSETINISITNSLFNANKTANNTALSRTGTGGAAARLRAYFNNVILNASIVNNTFVNNVSLGTANTNAGNFPVITLSRNNGKLGNITIANNIFWGNTENGGQLSKSIGKSASSSEEFNNTNNVGTVGTLQVTNNTDEDGFSTFPSAPTGTYVTDPNLNPAFQLSTGSYAIDTGNNSLATTAADLLGNQRIFNATVDRGAYEFGAPPLGIADNDLLEAFKIHPNPVQNSLNIQLEESLEKVEIYSIQGQKVLENNTSEINVSNLSLGMYLLKVYTQNGKVGVKRFIKN